MQIGRVRIRLGLVLETYTILIDHFPCDFTGVIVWLGLGLRVGFVLLKAMMLQDQQKDGDPGIAWMDHGD